MALWYREGLCFECVRCGRCCRGASGTVRLADREINAIARHMALKPAAFKRRYTRRLENGEISLREKRNLDCVLLDKDIGCSVYHLRPRQCRTWPFWQSVVKSKASWQAAARDCPGMNHGKRYSAAEIDRMRQNDGTVSSIFLGGLPVEIWES